MRYGTIVFQLKNIGSKSEGLSPFLYEGKGSFLKVWKDGDCSLIGEDLMPYDGKRVVIEGEIDEDYGIFLIENIQECVLENANEASAVGEALEICSHSAECDASSECDISDEQ